MAGKSIIIIGAGLAGLAAGCYAQMSGYRTRIYEQHTRPGGLCTAWKRKGYTIDGCIRWLTGARPGCAFHDLYRQVGALEGNRLLPLDRLVQFVDPARGQSLDVTADVDRLAADMTDISPGDRPMIEALVAGVRAFQDFKIPAEEPQARQGAGRLFAGLQQAWQMRRWLYALRRHTSVADFAAGFQHPFLRWAVSHISRPEIPLAALLILLAQLSEGKLAAVEGGSLAFALAIARRYLELGGQIVYGAPVCEILVEQAGRGRDRAIGVRLEGGKEAPADIVISAADGHSTSLGMLGGRYVDRTTRERYETWPHCPPIVMVSYGVRRAYPGEGVDQTIRLERPLAVSDQEIEDLSCRVYHGPAFAPAGKSVVRVTFTTGYAYWHDLQQADRARYEEEKERVAGQVLERLEGLLPGIGDAVEMTDVATPYTWQRYTRNRQGACTGWLLTPECLGRAVPRTVPGLDDFYMAGQWVVPGGGVPQVLLSGRQAVQLICQRDKTPFAVESG